MDVDAFANLGYPFKIHPYVKIHISHVLKLMIDDMK